MKKRGFCIAIRDDDPSYWTLPDELERVYGNYWDYGVKVSFSAIPCAYDLIHRGNRNTMFHSKERMYIYENASLISYLKNKIHNGQVEIMQHGYDHSYYISYNGVEKFLTESVRTSINAGNNVVEYLPECIHKKNDEIKKDIIEGKQILEDTFDVEIKVFVPPSNGVSAYVVDEIARMGMNISGTVTPAFNRRKTLRSIRLYMSKVLWHMYQKKISYPFVMDYGDHKELAGTTLAPGMNRDAFEKKYIYCKKKELPFVLATHSWEIDKNEDLHRYFDSWIKRFLLEGDKIVLMSELFE